MTLRISRPDPNDPRFAKLEEGKEYDGVITEVEELVSQKGNHYIQLTIQEDSTGWNIKIPFFGDFYPDSREQSLIDSIGIDFDVLANGTGLEPDDLKNEKVRFLTGKGNVVIDRETGTPKTDNNGNIRHYVTIEKFVKKNS